MPERVPNVNLVLILPTAYRTVGETISTALGYQLPGDQTYVVKLSNQGLAPATHYGCCTWASPSFVGLIQLLKAHQSIPSINWSLMGLTEATVFEMADNLLMSVKQDGEHLQHFNNFIATNGLQKIAEDIL